MLRDPHSGLTRTESNYLISKLFESQLVMHEDQNTHDIVVDGRVDAHGNVVKGGGIVFNKINEETGEEAEHTMDNFGNPILVLKRPTSGSELSGGSGKFSSIGKSNANSPDAGVAKKRAIKAQSMVVQPTPKVAGAGVAGGGEGGSFKGHAAMMISAAKGNGKGIRHSSLIMSKGKVHLSNAIEHRKKAVCVMQDISPKAFEELIRGARKHSIMRGMMHNMNKNAVHAYLLHALEHKRQDLINEGKLESTAIYVPVKSCYAVLEEAPTLRLSRSQVIAIISWSEAFDRTMLLVDYKRFALNASHVIDKLFDTKHQLARANVMDISVSNIDDLVIMNGLTPEDCTYYLEKAFSEQATHRNGEVVEHLTFLQVVRDIPLIKLAEKDIAIIYAATNHSLLDMVHWRPCLDWMYTTILDILKEKYIERRMALLAAAITEEELLPESTGAGGGGSKGETEGGHEGSPHGDKKDAHAPEEAMSIAEAEALSTLRSLAEKLVDFVKVRMEGQSLRILLPSDKGDYADTADGRILDPADAEDASEGLEGHTTLLVDSAAFIIPTTGRGGKKLREEEGGAVGAGEMTNPGAAGLFVPGGGPSKETASVGAAPPLIRRTSTMRNNNLPSSVTGHLKVRP